jgi:hypothetical protein
MIDPDPPNGASLVMRLCNIPTGTAILSDNHKYQLTWYILKGTFSAAGGWIDLIGRASKLGVSAENATLSQARCAAVKTVLEGPLWSLNYPLRIDSSRDHFTTNWINARGDTESQDDPTPNRDHGFFRAVEVWLYTQGTYVKPPPPPPPPHNWTPLSSSRFQFEPQEIASGSLSVPGIPGGVLSAGLDWMFFGIHDMVNMRRRYFAYIGPQVGTSVPGGKSRISQWLSTLTAIGVSAQHEGSPVPFQTDTAFLDLEDFKGTGSLTASPGATAGTLSAGGSLMLTWTPEFYKRRFITNPIRVPFSFKKGGGFGYSASGNLGLGEVKILSPYFRPTVYRD